MLLQKLLQLVVNVILLSVQEEGTQACLSLLALSTKGSAKFLFARKFDFELKYNECMVKAKNILQTSTYFGSLESTMQCNYYSNTM